MHRPGSDSERELAEDLRSSSSKLDAPEKPPRRLRSIQLDRPWPETNENMLGEATPPAQSTASSSPACLKPFAGESNRRGSQQHPNKLGYPVAAYLKYAGGHLAKDIQHINTGQWRLILKQRLLYGPPLQILSMFLLVYLSSVVLFALVYLWSLIHI